MADMFICSKDRKEVYKMPFLPESFPEFNRSAKNEEFETFNNGTYNILGDTGLMAFPLQGILPAYSTKYSFAKSKVKAYVIINFLARAMRDKYPIRIIVNRNPNPELPEQLLNMLVSVEEMTWGEDKVGDIHYNVSFKEYREYV